METIDIKEALKQNIGVVEELLKIEASVYRGEFSDLNRFDNDFNNIKAPGKYFLPGLSAAKNVLNKPGINFIILEVIKMPGGQTQQTAKAIDGTNSVAFRSCSSVGKWSEWRPL